jgi:hypothetical protein
MKQIIMDRRSDKVYFDTIEEAKQWAGCEDADITTADELEAWMTEQEGGICIHTFEEVDI